MKTVLLCLSLCGLVWTQSELQPHYKNTQQKCEGEHQITVKGRHSNHGFYIFNYIYSSLMPNNQTQIQKEDNKKTISTATDGLDKKHKPRKPSENFTPATQERSGEQKHLTGREDDIKPEDRTVSGRKQNVEEHHGSINNLDLQQHHIEFIAGKGEGESARGDNTIEIDGSGDIDFPGQVSIDHGIIVAMEDGDHSKGHKISSSTESGKFEGKGKSKSGKSATAKPPKNGTIKIWVKENDANLIQETNSYNDISRKIKDPQSKDYSEVSLKGKTNSTSKESSGKAGNYLGFSEKQVNVTARLYSNFNIQNNVSRDVLGKDDHTTKTNFTSTSGTIGIKVASEKGNHNPTMHMKGEYEPTVIFKLNGQKDHSGVAKPHQKSEARGDSGSHVEVFDAIKPHKKDNARKDATSGTSSSKIEATSISKTHKKDKGDSGITRESISQVEDPIFTKPSKKKHTEATDISEKTQKKEKGKADITQKVVSHMEDPFFGKLNKTKQSGIIVSVKIKDHVNGVTKSYPKGEIMSNKRISDSQVSTSNIIEQGRKDVTHKQSNIGQEDKLTKAHQKEVSSNEKIKTNLPESSMGDPATDEKEKNGLGVTFQEVTKDTVKGRINGYKDTGAITDPTKVDNTESSDRKAEQESQNSVYLGDALSLSHGSHNSVQLFSLPKNDGVQSQEHSFPSVKVVEKVIKPSRETANVHTGTHRDQAAIRYQKYSGVLRRKSSRHDKKHPSLKKAHRSDSSQSSESEEKRWKDSRQSYEDYQNDRADSFQSAESAEALSQESNQSDNHSTVED